MIQEPLPTADGFDDDAMDADVDWAGRSAEQRASAAGPAPMLVTPPPSLAPKIATAAGVSINPEGKKWDEEQFVPLADVKRLEGCWEEWKDQHADGEGEAALAARSEVRVRARMRVDL